VLLPQILLLPGPLLHPLIAGTPVSVSFKQWVYNYYRYLIKCHCKDRY
jgi:hypothetical protein